MPGICAKEDFTNKNEFLTARRMRENADKSL
jgi:hypothetical protein